MVAPKTQFTVSSAGQTLAAVLRVSISSLSWGEARRLIASRRVCINGGVCIDNARRLNAGDTVEVVGESLATSPPERQVRIVYSDTDIAVVEKPAGLQTVRRNEERNWSEERKLQQPVLVESVERMLMPDRPGNKGKQTARTAQPPRVRAVHRLDRDTSGLMLFALSAAAEQGLVRRFAKHEIERVYRAVAHGVLAEPRTIDTWITRDRGDGIRGSAADGSRRDDARRAITHVRPIELIGLTYSLVECRLETGRTHQIRIHLAEIGHMLCGEKVYVRPAPGAPIVEDNSGAPRQALHSAELRFEHPVTGQPMRFESTWPKDFARWIERLRKS
jgi:23S rRNA pseudouridine1911/1915/1917 synthase